MSALTLAWYAQRRGARRLWLAAGASLLLGGLESWFARELWLHPVPARLVGNLLVGLGLVLLVWLMPGLLWGLGQYCRQWWLRLLSMALALAGWCAALFISLLGVPLALAWLLLDAGS